MMPRLSVNKFRSRRNFGVSDFWFRIANRKRGFTLLEILVSIAILGMILLTIYSTWMMILRADRAGKYAAAEAQRERMASRTIEEALSCVQSFNESLQYYGFVADNGDETLSFVARLPSSFPRS